MPTPNPQFAREVLAQVVRILDDNHVPKTMNGEPLSTAQRVRFLTLAVERDED